MLRFYGGDVGEGSRAEFLISEGVGRVISGLLELRDLRFELEVRLIFGEIFNLHSVTRNFLSQFDFSILAHLDMRWD